MMVKRLFESLALGILAILGLAKLRGKKVNPLALRVLLGILALMALLLDSRFILLVSGTWLLFLLAGDAAAKFGINLSLFVPAAADADPRGNAVNGDVCEAGLEADDTDLVSTMKKGAKRCKSFITGMFAGSGDKK
ncbi:MAG: hypothetical protein ACI4NN_07860 [Pyramidobacter sp.]|jgi:hypothetical protein